MNQPHQEIDRYFLDMEKTYLTKNQVEQLKGLYPSSTYCKWKGVVLALFLEFNLMEMLKENIKPYSFNDTSRKHLRFDNRFAKHVIHKIKESGFLVPGKQSQFQDLLQKKCKTKFSTLKKSFNSNGGEDYTQLICKSAQELLSEKQNSENYVFLKLQLCQWEDKSKQIQRKFQENSSFSLNQQKKKKKKKKLKKTKKIYKKQRKQSVDQ